MDGWMDGRIDWHREIERCIHSPGTCHIFLFMYILTLVQLTISSQRYGSLKPEGRTAWICSNPFPFFWSYLCARSRSAPRLLPHIAQCFPPSAAPSLRPSLLKWIVRRLQLGWMAKGTTSHVSPSARSWCCRGRQEITQRPPDCVSWRVSRWWRSPSWSWTGGESGGNSKASTGESRRPSRDLSAPTRSPNWRNTSGRFAESWATHDTQKCRGMFKKTNIGQQNETRINNTTPHRFSGAR